MPSKLSKEARALKYKLRKTRRVPAKEFDSWGRPVYRTFMDGDFYKTAEWQKLRYQVLKENAATHADGKARCVMCGGKAPDVALQVDHKQSRHFFPSLELVKDNLQVLCENCNQAKGSGA